MGGFIGKLAALELAALHLSASGGVNQMATKYSLFAPIVTTIQCAWEELNHQLNPNSNGYFLGVTDNLLPTAMTYLISSSTEFTVIAGAVFFCAELSY